MRVGRRQSQTATTVQHTPGIHRRCEGSSHHAAMELSAIMVVASCLARKGTARLARQSRTIGPKRGCASSHWSYRALPREKQNAASNTNGVVGRSGTTIPMIPVARHMPPPVIHTHRCQRGISDECERGRMEFTVTECEVAWVVNIRLAISLCAKRAT